MVASEHGQRVDWAELIQLQVLGDQIRRNGEKQEIELDSRTEKANTVQGVHK